MQQRIGVERGEAPREAGDVRLWGAVLNLAIEDATQTDQQVEELPRLSKATRQIRRRLAHERAEARAWLCKRSEDLETVVNCAGKDIDDFLERMRALRDGGWQRPRCEGVSP